MYTCECYTLCKCIAVNPLRTIKNMLYVHCVCKPVNIIHYVMCSCEPLRTSKNIKSPSGLLAHLTFVYITHPSVCTRLQDDTVWSTTSLCVYLIGVIPLHVEDCLTILWYSMANLPPMCILPTHQDAKCPLLKFTVRHSLPHTIAKNLNHGGSFENKKRDSCLKLDYLCSMTQLKCYTLET